jgi:hypothetical protein
MIWLDSILAVPAIGVRIKLDISELIKLRDSVINLSVYLNDKYKSVEIQQKGVFGYSIKTPNQTYEILHNNIVADFEYKIKGKKIGGDFPVIEKPDLKSYSDIMNMLSDDIKFIFSILKDIKNITYDRIGIVAKTSLSKDSIPPGILTWIEYLGKPWGTRLLKTESTFFMKFFESGEFFQQCHHLIKFDETIEDKGYDLTLDWQQLFKEDVVVNFDKAIADIELCRSEAEKYFEKFAEGDLNYE